MSDEYEKRVNKENGKIYGTAAHAERLRNQKKNQLFLSGVFFRGIDSQLDKMADEAIKLRQDALEVEAKACEYLKGRVEKK
jgi:hypothetical protein